MHKEKISIIAAACFLLYSVAISADSANHIDWKQNRIQSTGTAEVHFDKSGRPVDSDSGEIISINLGRLQAYSRAREKALEEIIRSLRNVRIDSDNSVDDILRTDESTQSRLFELVRQKSHFREYPVNSYTAGCRAELKIHSIIAAFPYIAREQQFPRRLEYPVSTYYSSLIIDVRGLDVHPMVFPVIYNEDGLEIYGRDFIDLRYAAKYGTVRYAYSEKEATESRFAGEQPFFTVALKSHRGSPVISEGDAMKIFSSKRTLAHLRKCRVIFIINRGNR